MPVVHMYRKISLFTEVSVLPVFSGINLSALKHFLHRQMKNYCLNYGRTCYLVLSVTNSFYAIKIRACILLYANKPQFGQGLSDIFILEELAVQLLSLIHIQMCIRDRLLTKTTNFHKHNYSSNYVLGLLCSLLCVFVFHDLIVCSIVIHYIK